MMTPAIHECGILNHGYGNARRRPPGSTSGRPSTHACLRGRLVDQTPDERHNCFRPVTQPPERLLYRVRRLVRLRYQEEPDDCNSAGVERFLEMRRLNSILSHVAGHPGAPG